MYSGLQCPNCGGYRTYKFERGPRPAEPEGPSGCLYYLIAGLLILSVFGLLFGLGMLLGARKWREAEEDRRAWEAKVKEWEAKGQDPWYQYGYHCQICGYKWLQRPGEHLSVRPAPELRRMGEQLLREEEEAGRRRQEEERRRQEEEDFLLGKAPQG